MQVTHPEPGVKMNRVHIQPRSRDDLRARREAITRWPEMTNGWWGAARPRRGRLRRLRQRAGGVRRPPRRPGADAQSLYRRIVEDDLVAVRQPDVD
jgi:4-hydroxyphenylacetate 3-monooxygenase